MANKIEELKKDIAELEHFEKLATRQKNKDILSIEIRKLTSEVINLEEQYKNQLAVPTNSANPTQSTNRRYEVKLNNYAWDQSNKFVKFYVTLKDVHNIPAENIKCDFTPKNLELKVIDLENKDYVLRLNCLLRLIIPEQSNWKIKTDMVVINAAKKEPENWSHVTEWEKKSSDAKNLKPDLDDKNSDPSDGLMSLMKNMYEKGDDEMKRTIAKAWSESQSKLPQF
ncbi:calcyclin-binding protein [Anoplophora glabripennis]|uniref:calcyclin-binding protein n=1 Tax=Anoplophora glabripennis TaxID=217634 RepID=UPI0008736A86|nr:calcyclin-binding protein [Anoplophora glabripennis]